MVLHSLSWSKNKHMSRWVKIFFKFSGQPSTMLGNTLSHWTRPVFIFKSFWSDLGSVWWTATIFPETDDYKSEIKDYSIWNPHGFHVIHFLPNGIKWTGRYYSDNILSQITALRDVGSHRKRSSMPITPVRMLQNVSRNIWTITHWKEYLILLIHLISYHLIFIYLDILSINYRDMNSRKEQGLFRISRKFWIKFLPIHCLMLLTTGWEGYSDVLMSVEGMLNKDYFSWFTNFRESLTLAMLQSELNTRYTESLQSLLCTGSHVGPELSVLMCMTPLPKWADRSLVCEIDRPFRNKFSFWKRSGPNISEIVRVTSFSRILHLYHLVSANIS
jgi:hypothetical protein